MPGTAQPGVSGLTEYGQPSPDDRRSVLPMTQDPVTGAPTGVRQQARHAEIFASLHKRGDPLLLPNAWDVASAITIADAGAKAIATTSAGVAWSLGVPDAAGLGADRAAAVIERITAAVPVPVSADIEAGYGPAPDAVAATVTAVVQAGAVGINLEDRSGREMTPLFEPAEQAERLAAARIAADRLFVPGLTDLDAITELAAGPLPVAMMVWDGASTVAELTAAGAVRISLGSAIAQAAYAVAARATTELLTDGTYRSTAHGITYERINAILASTPLNDRAPDYQ